MDIFKELLKKANEQLEQVRKTVANDSSFNYITARFGINSSLKI